MTAAKHTPWEAYTGEGVKPWAVARVHPSGDGSHYAPIANGLTEEQAKAVALALNRPARIVACVNACEGMDDPAAFIRDAAFAYGRADMLRAQRDELIAALQEIHGLIQDRKDANDRLTELEAVVKSIAHSTLARIGGAS